jgi:hypothetical protein
MIDKQEVLDILYELEEQVAWMREQGETDLRTVLHYISKAYSEINKLEAK